MQAGKLRHRIEIQALTQAQDAYGDTAPSEVDDSAWATTTTRWASISSLTGSEYLKASGEGSNITHFVRLRYLADLTPKHRIKFGTRIFNILSVNIVNEIASEMQLFCKEVLT